MWTENFPKSAAQSRSPLFPLVSLLVLNVVVGMARGEESLETRISRLVRELGNPSFRTREAAQRELREIGLPALQALRRAQAGSDLEVRNRANQLVKFLKSDTLYSISHDGRLFRITVRGDAFQCRLMARLGGPFSQPKARVEGLAMSPDGFLFASILSGSDDGKVSHLVRVEPDKGKVKSIGKMLPTEVHGLSFGPDGRLFGVISSCRQVSANARTQLVEIDPVTAQTHDTTTCIALGDLDGLAVDERGGILTPNGACGLFYTKLGAENPACRVVSGKSYRKQLGSNTQLNGLCYGQNGGLYGVCKHSAHFLIRLDPKRGLLESLGNLEFEAGNLAYSSETNLPPIPAVAAKP